MRAYRAYLLTPAWKQRREAVLQRDGHRCTKCKATTRLEVHHLHYQHAFNEPLDDLTTLCNDCHQRTHGRRPPQKKTVLPDAGRKQMTKRRRPAKGTVSRPPPKLTHKDRERLLTLKTQDPTRYNQLPKDVQQAYDHWLSQQHPHP